MFNAENKENNAKSPSEEKPSKTYGHPRRSVLKAFDPFYSSPTVNKPNIINEDVEEDNIIINETQLNKMLENSKADERALLVPFETPHAPDLSVTEYLEKLSLQDQADKIECIQGESLKKQTLEVKTVKENEDSVVFNYKDNEECIVNFSVDSCEKSVPENQFEQQIEENQYFECQRSKSNEILFVDFNGTFNTSQINNYVTEFDPLQNSINNTTDSLDQNSLYEEALDTTYNASQICNIEPENKQVLEISNKGLEVALDGNDLEIEDEKSKNISLNETKEVSIETNVKEKNASLIKEMDNELLNLTFEAPKDTEAKSSSFNPMNRNTENVKNSQDNFEANNLRFAQDVTEVDDKLMDTTFVAVKSNFILVNDPVNTTFEAKVENWHKDGLEKAQNNLEAIKVKFAHDEETYVGSTISDVKNLHKDPPNAICEDTSKSVEINSTQDIKNTYDKLRNTLDAAKENKITVNNPFFEVNKEKSNQDVPNELMDTSFEAKKADIVIEYKEQDNKHIIFEVESAQHEKPMNTTFELKSVKELHETPEEVLPKARVSFGTDTNTCVVLDEYSAEYMKFAEMLTQRLDQTIDVEESAIVDDIDAIDKSQDNLDVSTSKTVEKSEDKLSATNEIQMKVETCLEVVEKSGDDVTVGAIENNLNTANEAGIVETLEKDADEDIFEEANSELSMMPKVLHNAENVKSTQNLEDSTESASKPKRIECRPSIRALRNKTQVIVKPLDVSNSDGNLKFEINLLQNEIKRIQEENAKKDQHILMYAMNREAAKDSIKKYEKIAGEYQKHIKMQTEILKLWRKDSNEIAASLISMETAFSNIFKSYEKAKCTIESFKKNVSILNEEKKNIEDKLTTVNLKCKVVQEKYDEEIKKARENADEKKEGYQQQVTKLQAIVKRLKIKAFSLDSSLKQKTEECQALATLCDDILKEKPAVS